MPKQRKAKLDKAKPIISLDQRLPQVPNRDRYSPPTQHLVKDGKGDYLIENYRRPSKTLLVNQIRSEVNKWRDSGYKTPAGISSTSLRLLEWWFDETHFFKDGSILQYYFAQREAIETIIYLYEVQELTDVADLVFKYMDPKAYRDDLFTTRKKIEETARDERILTRVVPETGLIAQQELPAPDHIRYAVKMATGSGKTLVMAMAIVWSFFNKKFNKNSGLSKCFLIIAPNVIVFERLREDFENGKIFLDWDLIPSDWKHDWNNMTYIMRGESRKSSTEGTLYLTNIHQIYQGKDKEPDMDPVNRLLGPKPKDATGSWEENILDRIQRHKELLIINDEAHHVHDTDLEWYKTILKLHNNLKEKYGTKLSLQLDFSATPKDQNGTFFSWITCDYPLAQAIEDRIVKAPLIVHQTEKGDPDKYSKASVAFADWINIAISRWQEHYKAYTKVGSKPVLFIMAENTRDADDIYDSLKSKVEFKGENQVLLIHTDKTGEISKKGLDEAREVARSIDLPTNRTRAIVSVLMLREGWDVKNVSVILGLRPFSAKANILPEQAVGRGLRLMKNIGPDYIQILEIIGTDKFEEFVKGLEVEGVGVGITRQPPSIGVHIYPVKIKEKYDIEIPVLTPSHSRQFQGFSDEILKGLPVNPRGLTIKAGIKKVELVDTVTQKTVGQKQVTISTGIPEINEILSHLTNRICKEVHIESQFALVYPILKKYVRDIFFGREVDLEHESIRRLLSDAHNREDIITTLARTIGKQTITKTISKLDSEEPLRLMELDGFYWRRDWTELTRTVFNITPCYNDFEKHFAKYLDTAKDISKFAKLAEEHTKFKIEYLNHKGAISYYYPDFIAEQRLPDKTICMWIIETKGWEQENVPLKDARAEEWCVDASKLTGKNWEYLKVKYVDYMSLTSNLSLLPDYTFEKLKTQLLAKHSGVKMSM